MSVTIEQIDKFVDDLMNEAPGHDYTQRLGRKVWYLKHALATNYGCPTCRPVAITLESLNHDVVNIGLGKKVHDPAQFERGVKMVVDAWKEYRNQAHDHSENVKIAGRMVHVIGDKQGIEALKEEVAKTKVSH